MLPSRVVAIEAPGDCDGKVWRKVLVEGARGEISAQFHGKRFVLKQ